jgi:protein CLEC16A
MPKAKGKDEKQWKYDFPTLEQIHREMIKFSDENTEKNKDHLIERIRLMTEFQIWGEKNNDSFFDFFCERNILELLLRILKSTKSRDVIIQIIQSLSMYLSNIDKAINSNYILSNNAINEFIMHTFDFDDEEVVDFYISFLKSLSLRLNTNPLQLFYNEKYNNFPLLSQAIRFYNHKEAMVRTTVQNITLSVFRLKDAKVDSYLTNFPFVTYFVNISCYIRDLWIKIDGEILDSNLKNHSRLKSLLDDQYDIIMYMEDVFDLKK